MIVLDASVVLELLINGPLANSLRRDLGEHSDSFIAPHLLDVEVLSAIRSLAAGQPAMLPVQRVPHTPLLNRMWELRHNFTAYDSAYIALAEATDSILYTSD